MIKTSLKRGLFFICTILMGISLAGCSSNLFSLEDPTYDSLTDQLTYAETNEELESVITNAETVIDNPDSSTQDIQEALVIKGEAILKQQGVNTGQLLADLIPLIQATDETTTSDSQSAIVNIFDIIDVSQYDANELAEAADSLNGATVEELFAALFLGRSSLLLSQTSSTTTPSSFSTSNSNDQLQRGIGNMMMALKIFSLVYVIDTTTNEVVLTPVDETQSSLERLSILMDPGLYLGTTNRTFYSLTHYASNAVAGFQAADAFDSDVEDELTKIETAGDNIESLYNATQGEGSDPDPYIFRLNGVAYDFMPGRVATSTINSNVDDAMTDIMSSISI